MYSLGRFAICKTPRGPRAARQARQRLAKLKQVWQGPGSSSPNQMLTHAARAAAKQLNKLFQRCLFRHLWWPRAAREGLW